VPKFSAAAAAASHFCARLPEMQVVQAASGHVTRENAADSATKLMIESGKSETDACFCGGGGVDNSCLVRSARARHTG